VIDLPRDCIARALRKDARTRDPFNRKANRCLQITARIFPSF